MSFLKKLFKKPKKAEVVERYWVEKPDGTRVLVTRKLEAGEKIIVRALSRDEVKSVLSVLWQKRHQESRLMSSMTL